MISISFLLFYGSAQGYRIIGPWEPIFKGAEIAYASTDTPRLEKITAIRIDLQDPDISFYPTPSNGGIHTRRPVRQESAFMTSSGCDIGINAHYYLIIWRLCGSAGSWHEQRQCCFAADERVAQRRNTFDHAGQCGHHCKNLRQDGYIAYWTAAESRQWFILKQGSIYSYGDVSIHPRSAVGITVRMDGI